MSTTHQDLDRQFDALGRPGIAPEAVYQDKKTGATIERPGFTERGIGINTLADPIPIDTTDDSAMAELAVALLALFAHMERVFMTERAAHARAVAAAKGKQPGRPRKLDSNQLVAARAALAADQPVEQVAAAFDVSRATLYRHLAQYKDERAVL